MNVHTAIALPLTLSLTYRTCKIQEEEAKSLLLLRLSLIPRLLDPFPGFSTPTCSLLDPFPGFLTPSCWLLAPSVGASPGTCLTRHPFRCNAIVCWIPKLIGALVVLLLPVSGLISMVSSSPSMFSLARTYACTGLQTSTVGLENPMGRETSSRYNA